MWYEALPGMGALVVALTIPGVSIMFFQRLSNGGKSRRNVRNPWHWHLVERDRRVSGTGRYCDAKGLESIK